MMLNQSNKRVNEIIEYFIISPSRTLNFRFQLLLGMRDYEFIVFLNAFTNVRCT